MDILNYKTHILKRRKKRTNKARGKGEDIKLLESYFLIVDPRYWKRLERQLERKWIIDFCCGAKLGLLFHLTPKRESEWTKVIYFIHMLKFSVIIDMVLESA